MALRLFSKLKALPEIRGAASFSTLSDYDVQHNTPIMSWHNSIPKSHYGGRHAASMLPGAGIGPECMGYVKEIFKYIGAPIDFEEVNIDPNVDKNDDVIHAISTLRRNAVGIKGNIETKSDAAYVTTRHMKLHNDLDLYAYVLNCKTYPGITTRHKNINITIVRQNTEGEYAMLEHEAVRGVIEALKVVTTAHTKRLSKFAFEFARKNKRKKVTTVHKANIMKVSDGLFLETSRQVAKLYPDIQHDDLIIDNCCMQLVARPTQFDVMLATNLYGSIISNVVCGMCGGPGLFSGRNYSHHCAVFEPATRNTGTAIAGKNIANPIAMIQASIDMLEHLGHRFHADLIRKAVLKTINEDKVLTADVGGTSSSSAVVDKIIENIGCR